MNQEQSWKPTISEKNTSVVFKTVYLFGTLRKDHYYINIIDALTNAGSNEVFIIKINSNGGYVSTAFIIADAIKKTKASVIVEIMAECASAATLIALASNNVCVNDYSTFMVHYYTSGYYGKGNNLKSFTEFNDEYLKKMLSQAYKGFLKDKEFEAILKGEDLYFSKDELVKRLQTIKKTIITNTNSDYIMDSLFSAQ
jgi:ATP-dependent protease ClpP protease subunit